MKTLIFTFLFLIPNLSFAQSPVSADFEEIVAPQVKILGEGIENRKTSETIAYACVGTAPGAEADCGTIRFIYFNPQDQKSYYFGTAIHLSSEDQATLKKIFKEIKKSYYEKNPTALRRFFKKLPTSLLNQSVVGASLFALAAAGMLVVVATNPIFTAIVGLEAILLSVTPGALTTVAVNQLSKVKFNPIGKTTLHSFQDTNSWNWSIHPKKISSKKFGEIFEFLKQMNIPEQQVRAN